MGINWSSKRLKTARIDPDKLESLINRLDAIGKEVQEMGMSLYALDSCIIFLHKSHKPFLEGDEYEARTRLDQSSFVAECNTSGWIDGGGS